MNKGAQIDKTSWTAWSWCMLQASFVWNNSSLYRKQSCWKTLKSEI